MSLTQVSTERTGMMQGTVLRPQFQRTAQRQTNARVNDSVLGGKSTLGRPWMWTSSYFTRLTTSPTIFLPAPNTHR